MSSEEQQLRNRSRRCSPADVVMQELGKAGLHILGGRSHCPSARCPALPLLCTHQPGPRRAKSCEPGASGIHEVPYSAGAVTQGLFHPIYILQLLMPPQNSLMTRIPNENVRCGHWEVAPGSLSFLFHRTSIKSEFSGGEQGPGCPGCHPSAWSRAEPVQG